MANYLRGFDMVESSALCYLGLATTTGSRLELNNSVISGPGSHTAFRSMITLDCGLQFGAEFSC